MSTGLQGKVALVTGASRGIGRGIAERLAADGALVAVHYASNDVAAKEVVSGIASAGGKAFTVQAELGTPGAVEQLLSRLDAGLADQGLPAEIDILVNNAAIALPGTIDAVDPAAFDHLLAVNVAAPFFLIQGALTRMRDGGRIVNVSSGVTRVAMPENIAYAMSKGALDILTRTLAKGVGARGITVNAVSPGVVDTDANAFWLRDNPGAQAFVSSQAALGRVGRPDDLADAVAFLVSDDGRWVTGDKLDVSGGYGL